MFLFLSVTIRAEDSNAMPFIEIGGNKYWVPVMSPKGYQVMLNPRRYGLLHGPRKTTKSNTAQNTLLMHAAKFDSATVGIFVKGLKGAVGSGVWPQICGDRNSLISQWNADPEGMRIRFETNPTMKSDTKMRWFRIYNQFGTVSEVQLHTIVRESEVESIVKDQQFSFIYLVEADRFTDENVFWRLCEQLRIPQVPHEERKAILDCNPPVEGEDHWLYRTFIKNRTGQYIPDIDDRIFEMGFSMDDNPFISDAEKKDIFLNNQNDEVNLQRFYYGKWVKDRKGTIFKEQFRPQVHVVGDNDPNDRTILIPDPEAFEMPTGWDLGDAKNHAAVFASRKTGERGEYIYDVVDELVILNQNYPLEEFCSLSIEKMDFWEAHMSLTRRKPQWRFWSDSSSLRYLSVSNGSEASSMLQWSNGRIRLNGVRKGAGSIKRRIELLKRILFENRIRVSTLCPNVISMLEHMRSGEGTDLISKDSPHKHVFDALTYMIGYEEPRLHLDYDSNQPTVGVIGVPA